MNQLNPYWTVIIVGIILTSFTLVFSHYYKESNPEPETYYSVTYFEPGSVYEWFDHLKIFNEYTNTVYHIYLVRRQLPITEKVKVILNRKLPETPVFTVETNNDDSLVFLEGNTLLPKKTKESAFSNEMKIIIPEKEDI